MRPSAEQYYRQLISGRRSGAVATLVRAGLCVAEIPYRAAVTARNRLYSSGIFASHAVDRPVICVGNITTGGTGKTPMVRWLAARLRVANHHPGVLMRGYKSTGGTGSDEQRLLRRLLGSEIPVHVQPDRVAGAEAIIHENPGLDVIILDDGFQHRRLRRDFDLVLIDATCAFGHDHLLPRGLLREPPGGLWRAHAIVLTHSNAVSNEALSSIIARLRRYNSLATIYQSHHRSVLDKFFGRKVFTFCGIGNPEAFENSVAESCALVGSHRFADHHTYSETDISELRKEARRVGAELLLTTEKDSIKIEPFASGEPPIHAVGLEIGFVADHEERLFQEILAVLARQS